MKNTQTTTFTIKGMHCGSCGMNIDGELEDTEGVTTATTSYAKAQSVVMFDPTVITENQLQTIIQELGYEAELLKD